MAITISWMLQKGGVGKSTQTGIMAWLLAKRGNRVLVVDMDSQGNVSTLLSQQDAYAFSNETVLEAVEDNDPKSYIVQVADTLHLLPADDLLATYDTYIYEIQKTQKRSGHPVLYLKDMLGLVSDDYDYILMDCPPSLNQQTVSALAASNYVVTVLQTEVYAFQALNRFFETLFYVKRGLNPDLTMLGISAGLMDRYSLQTAILEAVQEKYGDVVFKTVLRRLARISEFATIGISNATKDQKQALGQYEDLLDEVLQRIADGVSTDSIYFGALEEHLAYVDARLASPLTDRKRARFEDVRATLLDDIETAKGWL
ncbi:ParA family protein [Alicyclobacillus tolerans]|uniref:ParA family protein n=1 Tax=Alicyclobacillus tolerans TaxID=90970 RepID=UPI001F25E2D0|nr:ParA family protein [Alicyclobacillus tolerans]MCF8566992.1 ParA family protein [Alicyclobacillus tolerans]